MTQAADPAPAADPDRRAARARPAADPGLGGDGGRRAADRQRFRWRCAGRAIRAGQAGQDGRRGARPPAGERHGIPGAAPARSPSARRPRRGTRSARPPGRSCCGCRTPRSCVAAAVAARRGGSAPRPHRRARADGDPADRSAGQGGRRDWPSRTRRSEPRPAGRGPAPAAAAGPGHPAAGAAGPRGGRARGLAASRCRSSARSGTPPPRRRPAGSAPRRPRSPGRRRRRRTIQQLRRSAGADRAPVRPPAGAAARHAGGRGGGAAPRVGSDRRRPGPRRRGRGRARRAQSPTPSGPPTRRGCSPGSACPRAHLIVDGYNVTKTGYPGSEPGRPAGPADPRAGRAVRADVRGADRGVRRRRGGHRPAAGARHPGAVLAARRAGRRRDPRPGGGRAERPGRGGGQLGPRGRRRRRPRRRPHRVRRRRSSACSAGDRTVACRCPSVASAVWSAPMRPAPMPAPARSIGRATRRSIRRRNRVACTSIAITAPCGAPPAAAVSSPSCSAAPPDGVEWDETERAALGALADSGLVPPLRLVPSLPLRRREAG